MLREHLLAGRLTLEEFSERVEAALRARVGAELARVNEGLPDVFVPASGSRRKPARFTVALFNHVDRRGRLRLGGRALAASSFADLDFDLRDVTIDQWRTTVTVLAAFGNVDVYVPEGVNVDVSGISLVGHGEIGAATLTAPTPRPFMFAFSGLSEQLTSGGCRRTCGTPAIATSSASFKADSASFPAEVARKGSPGTQGHQRSKRQPRTARNTATGRTTAPPSATCRVGRTWHAPVVCIQTAWPLFGRPRALNAASHCAPMSIVSAGQQRNGQVAGARDTVLRIRRSLAARRGICAR